VAIATPPGRGALGVVRLSGPDACPIAGTLLPMPGVLDAQPSHTIRRVRLIDPDTGASIDEAMCAVMRAPRSYTGEDVVELSCHGGPALLGIVVDRLLRGGARLAAPGEFTRRAFLNGRIDLARAEAVALLITARTERAAALAARALEGELAIRIGKLREAMIDLVAGLEVGLDFPDEHVGLDANAGRERVEQLVHDVEALLAASRRGSLVHDGVTIALVGRPNAGKSSLLNALLGRDRAIVSPIPGTTRDIVDGAIEIAGAPVRLLDTAGLATAGDPIEAEGMNRTRYAIDQSDIVLVVVDGSIAQQPDGELRAAVAGRRVIEVRSKSDLPAHPAASIARGVLAVSARTGDGIPAFLDRLADEVGRICGVADEDGQLAATLRQREGLEQIRRRLLATGAALSALPLEVALVDLRDALDAASALLGLEVGDAVLDRVFATFCLGK
jgi:tRNA modification GTPase